MLSTKPPPYRVATVALRWSIRITVSAPTIFGRLSETTVWAPKPCVTSSETLVGVEPAPSPQPARASAASTQILASSRTAWGGVTSSVSVPACVSFSVAVPPEPVLAVTAPALMVAPTALDGAPLASL